MQKIMFNDRFLLTQAVLEGRKTQTRRRIKFSPTDKVYGDKETFPIVGNRIEPYIIERYSRYKVGEIIAVAQKYEECGGFAENGIPMWCVITEAVGPNSAAWDNKMFVKPDLMPHQIRITGIRVERLQDISDEDCLKEGIEFSCKAQSYYVCYDKNTGYRTYLGNTPREAYADLIDKVSGKGTWEKNPYVFVYDFELVK